MEYSSKEQAKRNFENVVRQYELERKLRRVSILLRATTNRRETLLRDFNVVPVDDPWEINFRYALDEVLHTCGVIEIGLDIGVLGDTENFGKNNILPLLQLPEMRTYYEVFYPIPLPTLYRRRLQTKSEGNKIAITKKNILWYSRFLEVDRLFRDRRLEELLLVVDGFWIDGFDFDELRKYAKSEKNVVRAIMTPQSRRSIEQRVLAGVERFLFFCSDLRQILSNSESKRISNKTFDLYRYWFRARSGELGEVCDIVLGHIGERQKSRMVIPERKDVETMFRRARVTKPCFSAQRSK